MKRLSAYLLLAIVLAWAKIYGQETAAPSAATDPAALPKDPPFVASLLLIKADWSQTPAAKEIEADWQRARGEEPNLKLLDESQKAGPGLLFFTGAASIYTEQHYAQVLAWLKARQLFQQVEPFQQFTIPSGDSIVAHLHKDTAFFGVPPLRKQEDPLGAAKSKFTWKTQVWPDEGAIKGLGYDPKWYVYRDLQHYEKDRGWLPAMIANTNAVDGCRTSLAPLEKGHVLIVHAFPGVEDAEYRKAAQLKGFQALIVFENPPLSNAEAAEPRLVLPDNVERIISGRPQAFSSEAERNPPPAKLAPSPIPNAAPAASRPPKRSVETATVSKPDEPRIKVFTLRNMQARDAERIFNQLFGREIQSAAADERTNSLIVRATAADEPYLNIVYAILTRLDDEELGKKSAPPAAVAANRKNAETAAAVAELSSRYETKDRQALELARHIRELPTGGKSDKARLDKLSAELRREASEAFTTRQQLQQAELSQLQQRIEGIQQNLKTRAALSEQIIDRRVKDLLNPDLQWDAPPRLPDGTARQSAALPPAGNKSAAASATTASKSLDAKTTSTDSGLAQPKNVSLGASAYTVLQNVLGVDFEFVVGSTVSSAGFRGGFLVTKTNNPGLQAGDIIVGLNGWETLSDSSLAWAALQPADKKIIFQMPKARQTAEIVPVHIVRDGKYQTIKVEVRPWAPQSQRSPASLPPASTSSSTTDKLTSAEAERIWNVLGVKVRPWASKNEDPFSPKSRYTGGAEITEVRPDGPVDGPSPLRNGDIIVQLGEWEVFSPQRLAVILSQPRNHGEFMKVEDRVMQRVDIQVLRGNDKVSNTVVIPLDAATETVQTSVDLTAARAYRDKLLQRWEQVEKLYEFGRFPLNELLQAAKELGEADLAAAATADERRTARQQSLERLKKVKAIVDAQVGHGAQPEHQKLAAEAEVLKAEAQLTDDRIPQAPRERSASRSNMPMIDPTAARAYRDKLRERVELLKRGFNAGEMPHTEYLRALIQLDDAEIATSASPGDRKKALQAKVDHLKQDVETARRLHGAGELNQADLFAAQAELLKAEAELTAEKTSDTVSSLAETRPTATNTVLLGTGEQTVTLRTPDDFRQQLLTAEGRVKRLQSDDLAHFGGDSPETKAKLKDRMVNDAQTRLTLARAEYAAQLKLLELEVQDAQSAVEAAEKQRQAAEAVFQKNPATRGQLTVAERATQAAQLRVQRATTLLELYRKADPKQTDPAEPTAESAKR